MLDATKPPYRVPLMTEIAKLRPNGRKVISTFAGCGGSSLGYRMAGFKVLWASEFIDAARKVYEENAAPGTIVDGRDIREVDPLEVLKLVGLKPGELDVLDGSPPCASFSTAGKREKHWGSTKKYSDKTQRTDDLFFEYVRFLKAMQPKVFVAENVSGLVKGTAKGYFLKILAAMKACGYRVEASLLDAQWLGVPQTRQRIIFVGVRNDLSTSPAFPLPRPHRYSVRDAIPWITRAIHDTSGQFSTGEFTNKPCPAITVGGQQPNACHYKIEGEEDHRPGVLLQGPETDFRNAGRALDSEKPAPTVVAGDAAKRTPRQFEVRVVHATGRKGQPPKNVIDRPCPTITAGPEASEGGGPCNHFQIERPVRILPGDRGNRRRREEGRPHSLDEPLTAVLADGGRNTERAQFMIESETDISRQAIGREYDKLNPGQSSEKYFSLIRADAGEPCPTVTAAGGMNSGIACVVHPTEKRKFSIAELKRICAFPDDFALCGTYAQQWERLGRAVPPLMMKAIAETVRDQVLPPAPTKTAAPASRSRRRSTKG